MALVIQDIEDVFNVAGAISANSITFILPTMFYIFLILKKKKEKKIQYYVAWGVFVFSIPFGVFSVAANFRGRS